MYIAIRPIFSNTIYGNTNYIPACTCIAMLLATWI